MRRLGRRAFLRGAGALLALPCLDALAPLRALAGAGVARAPVRLLFVFLPNGVHVPTWRPAETGGAYTLPWTLEPLAPVRDEVCVLSGLALDGARAHGDGPGDHARAAGSFLTCAHPVKTGGAGIRAGVSVDQVAAEALGTATRFRSLELGLEGGAQSGECDSGYSCAYSSNVSWRTPTLPNAKETEPRRVFERLFSARREGETAADAARRLRLRASVLDHVQDDARDLARTLGRSDRAKLEEYLTSVRELERRIESSAAPRDAKGAPDAAALAGPHDAREHLRLLLDLVVAAFRADLTRVATLMVGNAGSSRSFPFLDVPDGWHGISHHGGDPEKNEKIRRIDRHHVEQFAYLVERMRATPDGDGTLLDHALVLAGSAIADGNRHDHHDLPILLAGRGGGAVRPGRHLRAPRETPLANAYVTMLHAAGVPVASFGDSDGALDLG